MIIWFTQPPGKFASYYQYDDVTRQFVRVRLELGRASDTRTNDTFVSYSKQRAVGFSKTKYSSSDLSRWTVNDKGELCYNKTPLPGGKPNARDMVYDTSDPSSFVHRGNQVTEDPSLPKGIESKHLTLLANDAMISKPASRIKLTAGDAAPEKLVEAIQGEVCRILNVKDFASVTDDLILSKLTSQSKAIGGSAAEESVSGVDKALTTAEDEGRLIVEQIEEGAITPTPELESAVGSMQSAITSAQKATGASDVQQALTETSEAQQAVTKAIENIDTAKNEVVASQLDSAKEALIEAQQSATEWQSVEQTYKPLTEASSVDDYMETMSDGEGL